MGAERAVVDDASESWVHARPPRKSRLPSVVECGNSTARRLERQMQNSGIAKAECAVFRVDTFLGVQ